MKRVPWASISTAPSPRTASEMSTSRPPVRGRSNTVGWNCTNSISRVAAPARRAMARPSAVATAGLEVSVHSAPTPPAASTTSSASQRPTWPLWKPRTPHTVPSAVVNRSIARAWEMMLMPRSRAARRRVFSTSHPDWSPACTMRRRLCPPSRCRSSANWAPWDTRRSMASFACWTSSVTRARSPWKPPAAIVSSMCRSKESSGEMTAARPPWAHAVELSAGSPRVITVTERVGSASTMVSAAVSPAAPEPMMSTSVRSAKLSAGVISSVVMLFLFAGARVADGNHALDRGARGIRSLLFDEYLILSLLQALE